MPRRRSSHTNTGTRARARARAHSAHSSRFGKKHPHKGHPMSAATRAKISAALRGRHHRKGIRRARHHRRRSKHLKRHVTHHAHRVARAHRKRARHSVHRGGLRHAVRHSRAGGFHARHHLLKRESFYRLRSGRPRTTNRRLHLRAGRPLSLRRRLKLSRRGTFWQDRGGPNVMSMPRII